MRFLGVIFLSFFLISNINAACNTEEKKEEKEKQKALKILGYSGAVLDSESGKYIKYDIKSCEWKEVKE
tara:strand:+ start:254 stop:460 length:207 start_codon:yes stop_codon:yes gene_type:complete